ncbi:hypothetical protein BRAS3843_730012 [Bradyrhizobium sp. STM 3843]|uniref:hypothetical protein n=1 Tax=Bradyrhizobium sp. STM 3843 TaxID=551947 RepID=UPI00024040A1|nr:hypothetical protein [Bradyrhizobium sp. STM 3843]CCE11579.1 hypothetical protein BRAS3843_730012 [Bradyrhizobium sp. STM 3843]
MMSIDLHRSAGRGFGKDGAAPLARATRRLRVIFKKIRAAIAAARLRQLRDELISRRASIAAPEVKRQPQLPLVLGDKWDF